VGRKVTQFTVLNDSPFKIKFLVERYFSVVLGRCVGLGKEKGAIGKPFSVFIAVRKGEE